MYCITGSCECNSLSGTVISGNDGGWKIHVTAWGNVCSISDKERRVLAAYGPLILENGEYYRLFTSMFLHFGYDHLFNNMVVLVAMGWNLELEIGKIKFLIVYFISGLAGNILSAWWDILTGSMAVSAGASGAIFGIIGALLYVAIRNRGRIGEISGKGLVFMVVLTLYYGFTSGGVDNMAHIGGLAAGFLMGVLLYRKRKDKRGSVM